MCLGKQPDSLVSWDPRLQQGPQPCCKGQSHVNMLRRGPGGPEPCRDIGSSCCRRDGPLVRSAYPAGLAFAVSLLCDLGQVNLSELPHLDTLV